MAFFACFLALLVYQLKSFELQIMYMSILLICQRFEIECLGWLFG